METRSGFAEINGARLYYEEAGEGFPLVLVHAGIADQRMWDDQFAVFAAKYRTIRFDMRGFGQSEMVPGPFAYRSDLYELMRFLRVERAYLMGCSMGGGTIIDFAVEHPEMTAALIPVGSALSGYEWEGDPPPFFMELQEAAKLGDFDSAAEYAVRVWIDSRHRTPEQMDPALRAKVREMSRIGIARPSDLGEEQYLTPPAVQRLEMLRQPMLVIVGDLDDSNIMTIADVLTAAVPGAKKIIMSDTAHLPNMERPQEFNQVVMSFLESIGPI